MKISPARTAAFDVLIRIEKDGAFSSALLPQFEESLSDKDRALCHELTLGVLRRKLYLDHIIDVLAKDKRLDLETRTALRLGLLQLIFLDRIPTHAAIDQSVELVLRAKKRSAKAFVNAILRSFQRQPFEPQLREPVERFSIKTSHPRWLVERWVRQFGLEEAEAICEANNKKPKPAFRTLKSVRDADIDALISHGSVRRSEFIDGVLLQVGAMLPDGVYVQDEGSLLVASAVAAEKGGSVIDVCAAPGGKTTFIAEHAKKVVAGDIHSNRVALLRRTCEMFDARNVFLAQYDARQKLPFKNETFDVVFVDVPCSGTGTIRNNPEIRYSLSEVDIPELSRKQRAILKNASELVRSGGKLIYSTCSLEREENEEVCIGFETFNPDFARSTPKVPMRFVETDGFARTFPHRDNMDGFFIACFERK